MKVLFQLAKKGSKVEKELGTTRLGTIHHHRASDETMLNYQHFERKYYDAVEDCFRVPQRVNRLCGTKMVRTR